MICPFEKFKKIMMIDPIDADIDKCKNIGKILGPMMYYILHQRFLLQGFMGRNFDFDNKQGNGNGKNTITESLQS